MAPVKKLLNVVGSCEIRGRLRCNAASIGYRNRIRKALIHSRVTRVSWIRCQGINLRMGPSRTSVPTTGNSGRNGNHATGDPRRGAVIGFAVADSHAPGRRQTPCPGRAQRDPGPRSSGKIRAENSRHVALGPGSRSRAAPTASRHSPALAWPGHERPGPSRAPQCRRRQLEDDPLAATSTPDRPAGSR
jgi:hypothetical protein